MLHKLGVAGIGDIPTMEEKDDGVVSVFCGMIHEQRLFWCYGGSTRLYGQLNWVEPAGFEYVLLISHILLF